LVTVNAQRQIQKVLEGQSVSVGGLLSSLRNLEPLSNVCDGDRVDHPSGVAVLWIDK
jgi:hypothetical protein